MGFKRLMETRGMPVWGSRIWVSGTGFRNRVPEFGVHEVDGDEGHHELEEAHRDCSLEPEACARS